MKYPFKPVHVSIHQLLVPFYNNNKKTLPELKKKKTNWEAKKKMAAAAMAVHLPKHSSFLPKPKLPLDKKTNFLGGSFNLGRPMSVNREFNSPVMVSASSTSKTVLTDDVDGDQSKRFYINFTGFPFPLGPFLNRRTIRTEVSFCSISQFR